MTQQQGSSGAMPKLLITLVLVGLMVSSAANTALAQATPYLMVEDTTLNMHGQSTLKVPVLLNTGSSSLSTIIFSLSYDNTCLTFDNVTDNNNDGVPNAITTHVPQDFITRLWNTGSGEVTLIIRSPWSWPLKVIGDYADEPLVDIEFGVLPGCINTVGTPETVPFSFPFVTFGNDMGGSEGNASVPGNYTLRFNAAPTTISLDPSNIYENQPFDTVVGTLVTDDPDSHLSTPPALPAEGHTYSLVDDGCTPGSYNNSPFWIDVAELKTVGSLDYESAQNYLICVRSTDKYGLTKDQDFNIVVNDLGEIADIQLSNDSPAGEYHVMEGTTPPYGIGQLTTLDDNQGRSYNYSLVGNGCGGNFPDNGSFILGDNLDLGEPNWLWATAVFSYTEQPIYNICVRSTDSLQLANYLERTFTILVDNTNDAPVAFDDYTVDHPLVARNFVTTPIYVLENDMDPDGDVLKVNTKTSGIGMYFEREYWIDFLSRGSDPTNPYRGPNIVKYTAKDHPTGAPSNEATVYMYLIGDYARGDCNRDGTVDAGDLTATVREIYDADEPLPGTEPQQWWYTHLGGFDGSALGCDSNGLRNGPDPEAPQDSVGAADLTCTVRLTFGESCGGAEVSAASAASTATLHVPDGLQVAAGKAVAVPVILDTAGQNVSAIAFTLDFDAAVLNLDPADSDGDGIADAVSLNIPAGMARMVSVDAQAGHIQVAIFGMSLPLPTLEDGAIASVALQAAAEVAASTTALDLTRVSLGDDLGQSVPVMANGNNVMIGSGGSDTIADGSDKNVGGSDNQLYLPQVRSNNN